MNKKEVKLNIFASFLLQIVTIISGFIIPKIILTLFGSEMNGLITSINQFLNYITLLEGGVSGVIMASLYKPIEERNIDKISGIVNATNHFFRTIGRIYIIYMVIVAFGYYFFTKSSFSYGFVASLVLILGMNLFVQYYFSLTYKVLLNASGKVYIVSLTQILIIIVNVILLVVIAEIYPQIHLIKLGSAVVFLLQPVMYTHFVKKFYKLDIHAEPDNVALSQRWDGFGQNLAFFIHSNTDVVLLTLFSGLLDVSVYSIYSLVVKGLKSMVISFSTAVVPSMGKILARGNKDEINSSVDMYEFGMDFVATLFFTCGVILIVPFVRIYTARIQDADYIRPLFGILLLLSEYVYCFRDPYVSISYASGHFKQTAKYAYMEAIVNILISVMLIRRLGLVGIAVGTLAAMLLRLFCSVYYLKKYILHRSYRSFFKKIAVFWSSSFVIIVIFMLFVKGNPANYLQWIFLGAGSGFFTLAVLALCSYLFFRKEFCGFLQQIKKGK